MTPIPRKTSTDCLTASPTPPTTRPIPNSRAAAEAAARGPRRSTHGPPNAALKPSSISAVVNVVYGGLNHHGFPGSNAWIGRLKVLQAYTEPMQMCTATAPTGINHRLKPAATAVSVAILDCVDMFEGSGQWSDSIVIPGRYAMPTRNSNKILQAPIV